MNELHLFAGVGGGILGGMMLGHTPVGAVEIDDHARQVLLARQDDECLPSFPVHDDIRTFDATPFHGTDIVAGGFPCQDISVAGCGEGLDGDRSGLWWEMRRVVREVEPKFVFVENTPALLVRGFDRVLGSLADLGFDAEWCVLSAGDCGAPHLRRRCWILAAHPDRISVWKQQQRAAWRRLDLPPRWQTEPLFDGEFGQVDSDTYGRRREEQRLAQPAGLQGERRSFADGFREARQQQHPEIINARKVADPSSPRLPLPERQADGGTTTRCGDQGRAAAQRSWWATEPSVGRMAHGVPNRVGRLRGTGNAQVPVVAARAFRILAARFLE